MTGTQDHLDRARELLTDKPGRITQPRIAILAQLVAAHRPLTHAEIQEKLPDLDRVSIYRVLDWLAEHDLAERVTSDDGLRRFVIADDHGNHHMHPHFTCSNCAHVVCLHDIEIQPPKLPRAYEVTEMAVMIRGICPNCRSQ